MVGLYVQNGLVDYECFLGHTKHTPDAVCIEPPPIGMYVFRCHCTAQIYKYFLFRKVFYKKNRKNN